MVDLPIPQQNTVTAEAPRERLSSQDYMRSADAIGNGFNQLAAGTEQFATTLSEQKGRDDAVNAVTRDPATGAIQVQSGALPIFGAAGNAYADAVSKGASAAGNSAVSEDLRKISLEHADDPVALKVATDAYLNTAKASWGTSPLGQTMLSSAQNLSTQYYNGALSSKKTNDTNQALQSINQDIQNKTNELVSLAQQPGGENTKDYEHKLDALHDAFDGLKENSDFQQNPDVLEAQRDKALALIAGAHVTSQVDAEFSKGGRAGADKFINDELRSSDLKADEKTRVSLIATAQSRISFLEGQNKAESDNLKTELDNYQTLKAAGKDVSDTVLAQGAARAAKIGDVVTANKFQAMRTIAPFSNATKTLTPEEMQAAHGIGSNSTATGDYYSKLSGQESSGNNNAKNPSSTATGSYQFIDKTWEGIMASHPELGLTLGGRTDPVQAKKAVIAFTQDNQAVLQKAGFEANDKNTYLAHFMGAGGAVNFLQAAKTNSNQSAAALFPDSASANKTVFYNSDGSARTLAQVYDLQTKQFSGQSSVLYNTGTGTPFTQDQVQKNPYLLSEVVRTLSSDQKNKDAFIKVQGNAIESAINNGNIVHPSIVGDYANAANSSPQHQEQFSRIQTSLQAQADFHSASQGGEAAVENYKNTINKAAQSGDLHTIALAQAFQKEQNIVEKMRTDDPSRYAARLGLPAYAPLDATSQQSATQSIQQSSQAVTQLTARDARVSKSVITPEQSDSFKAIMQGQPDKAVNILEALKGLPPEQLTATLQNSDVKNSIIQATRSNDPVKVTAAFSFLNSNYNNNPLAFKTTFGQDSIDRINKWQNSGVTSQSSPEDVRDKLNKPETAGDVDIREMGEAASKKALAALTPVQLADSTRTGLLSNLNFARLWGGIEPLQGQNALQSGLAMVSDYKEYHSQAMGSGATIEQANEQAQKQLALKWGVSNSNNGRIMVNPPERYYDAVNGSHSYIEDRIHFEMDKASGVTNKERLQNTQKLEDLAVNKQFDDNDYKALGADGKPEAYLSTEQLKRSDDFKKSPYALVSDTTTQGEIDKFNADKLSNDLQKKLVYPSYLLSIVDPSGRHTLLTDENGAPKRLRFDTASNQAMKNEDANYNAKVDRRNTARDALVNQPQLY